MQSSYDWCLNIVCTSSFLHVKHSAESTNHFVGTPCIECWHSAAGCTATVMHLHRTWRICASYLWLALYTGQRSKNTNCKTKMFWTNLLRFSTIRCNTGTQRTQNAHAAVKPNSGKTCILVHTSSKHVRHNRYQSHIPTSLHLRNLSGVTHSTLTTLMISPRGYHVTSHTQTISN